MALLGLLFGTGSKLKIAEIDVEVCLSESHEDIAQMTNNPVEDGVDVTDHVQLMPTKLVIEGAVSNTPIKFLAGLRSLGSDSATITLYQQLLDLHTDKTIVSVQTGIRLYEDMIISELRVPRDPSSGSVLKFTATFTELVTVNSALVAIPKGLGGTKKNMGTVQPKAATPSKGNGSLLTNITGKGA